MEGQLKGVKEEQEGRLQLARLAPEHSWTSMDIS
jgi:hypothetical protein